MKNFRKFTIPMTGPWDSTDMSRCLSMTAFNSCNPGREIVGSFRCMAAISRNIQGFPRAPRATMTASHPVSFIVLAASPAEKTSPLAMTGMETVALTALITSRSAFPLYP
jgi:hypothetical protein